MGVKLLLGTALAGSLQFGPEPGFSGPAYPLDAKALGADLVVELEMPFPSRSLGWRAAVRAARAGRVVRTIYRREGAPMPASAIPRFPFSMASRCWPRKPPVAVIRVLVFLAGGRELAGVETDAGGYSSLNPRYRELVEAVAVASSWTVDSRPDEPRDGPAQALGNPNPYLRFLAARFRARSDPDTAATLQSAPTESSAWPEAGCGSGRSQPAGGGIRP